MTPHYPDELSNEQIMQSFTTSEKNGNLATNLIHLALGAGDKENYPRIAALLSILPPKTRRHRDDMTVMVTKLGEKGEGNGPRLVNPVLLGTEGKLESILKSLKVQ